MKDWNWQKVLCRCVIGIILLGPLCLLPDSVAKSYALDTCPSTLSFGETAQCAISAAGEQDAFTFSAQAGDIVVVRMSATSGNLTPYIHINTAEASPLCSKYSSTMAEVSSCTLPVTGTYTIVASDYGNTDTGNYQLYLQCLNNPANPVPIAFNETLSGSIAAFAELDAYIFTAQGGDVIVAQMTPTSGDLAPYIRVYDSLGTQICSAYGYGDVFLSKCSLPVAGTFALLVGDYPGRYSGVYNLYLQRLYDPVGSVNLPFAETRSGTIIAAAEMDAYTFEGNMGDIVLIRANPASAGGLDPYLRLYDPNGTVGCSDVAYNGGMAEITDCALASAGKHTLLISDEGGLEVGSYDLFMTSLKNPAHSLPLAFNSTQIASTGHAVELLAYTLVASAGDIVVGQVGIPNKNLDPQLRLYSQNGSLVCQDYAYTQYGEDTARVECILPADGNYLILVGTLANSSRQIAGAYQVHFQRLNLPVNPSSIYFDSPVSASIAQAAEIDTFTFRAAAGDVVSVRMSAAKKTIDPYIRLYGTNGARLGEKYDLSEYFDVTSEIANCTLPFSGTYTLLAADYAANEIGNYVLYLDCLKETCGFPLELEEKVYLPVIFRQARMN